MHCNNNNNNQSSNMTYKVETKRVTRCAYLVALYNGHPGHAQHSNSINMANATSSAKPTNNQNSMRFSALYMFYERECVARKR